MRNNQTPELEELFQDLDHPNPNINYQASIDMYRFWPDESKVRLLNNLIITNVQLRRKSIKALACFGPDIIRDIVKQYFLENN